MLSSEDAKLLAKARRRALRRRGLRRLLLIVVSLHAVLIAAVSVADRFRKRRGSTSDAPYPWEAYAAVCIDDDAAGQREGDRNFATAYSHGGPLFADMLAAIDAAEREICIESFIWKSDAVGRAVRDALARRARAGVAVRIIFDVLGNLVVPRGFRESFPAECQTLAFRPLEFPGALRPGTLFRDHRKILTVDNRVGFIGGFNIGSRYSDGTWRDTHMRLEGPCVMELSNAFADFWNAHHLPEHTPIEEQSGTREWRSPVSVHRNDPDLRIFPIRAMYLEAIDRAAQRIWMTQAYFVPDRAFRTALTEAAARGVDVRIILPWHSNHIAADWAGRRHVGELLAAGVKIFAYQALMIHSKTAVIDGVWTTVGTANIDRLSMLGNYEVNAEIRSERFARIMEDMFELDLTNAVEITAEQWARRSALAKVAERGFTAIAPFV